MNLDLKLFMQMLGIDSTSSKERDFAGFLAGSLPTAKCSVSRYEVGDGTENLMLSWGKPEIVFCSHLDTVPPYIPRPYNKRPRQLRCQGTDIRHVLRMQTN